MVRLLPLPREGGQVSVVVTGKVRGDTDAFRRFIANREDMLRKIAEDAKSKGAIHHRFAIGDGFVLIVDEWESVEAFQQFFQTNSDIPTAMQEGGAQGEPEFTFAEAVETADQF
jgi:heme-degrading monooxygenase HmoA